MAAIVQVAGLTKQVQNPSIDGKGQPLIILHDVSFAVDAGESLAIVGASGSGKSTLLGLLAGLDIPSSGKVWLNGADLFALDEDGRARLRGELAGFVFQSFQLLPALNALENVMLPLELVGAKDARSRAEESLQQVGLSARAHHLPKHLSGGEQQRVALARAFVTRPKILFADEPTGNLDAATGAQVIALMLELNRAQGTTLILVTHDEALARRCGKQLRLDAGRAYFKPAHKENVVRLHKIEIARRQIEVAAELFFAEQDFLAVITLAGAAEEILGKLLRRTGETAMIDHLVELDKRLSGGRSFEVVKKEVNGIRNALKHASNPSEDEIEVNSGEAIAMLGRAVVNYVKLNIGQPTPIMIRVYEHLKLLHPDAGN